jgi:tRNA-specific 2-thiouridylase
MSGGIDSSVAAWILKRDAHEVVGVTFRFHDSPLRAAAIERAQRCAEDLAIEHHVIDLRGVFDEKVKNPTTHAFADGLFFNPCTVCTRDVKIPALFEQADIFGCEKIATGHYANITTDAVGFQLLAYQLRAPLDRSKDQTFLLYTLGQDQLSRLMFPLADVHKGEARRLAMRMGLMRIAPVNDGQGDPCFYNGRGYLNWLEGEGGLAPKEGRIMYLGDNSCVGTYDAQYRIDVDQSLGTYSIMGVPPVDDADAETVESPEPVQHDEGLFAVFKDAAGHTIYAGTRALAGSEMCMLRDVHWTSIEAPREKRSCRVRIAYDRKPLPAQIVCKDDGVVVAFNERVLGLRAGQPVVFYSDDLVLGGGLVVG